MLKSKVPVMAESKSRAPKISGETYQAILTFVEKSSEPALIEQIAKGVGVEVSVIRRAMAKLYRHPDYTFLKLNENSNSLSRYTCIKRTKSADVVSMLFGGHAEAAALKHKKMVGHY